MQDLNLFIFFYSKYKVSDEDSNLIEGGKDDKLVIRDTSSSCGKTSSVAISFSAEDNDGEVDGTKINDDEVCDVVDVQGIKILKMIA